jgi:outer membrane protein assembly factor BamB
VNRNWLGLIVYGVASSLFGADWPEFLGPNRDNTSPETGLMEQLGSNGPPLVWEKRVGTGYSAPSVKGGTVVLHERVGEQEVVRALKTENGEALWEYRYGSRYVDPFGYNNGPRCSPLLAGDRCYTFGAEGVLLCMDLRTGKLIWRKDTQREFDVPEAFFGVGSSPVLEDNLLFVALGGQPNAAVVALDARTGDTVWANGGEKTWTGLPMLGWPGERQVAWNRADPAFEKQASYCTPVLATLHGRRILFCVMRQGLIALEPKSGAHLFSRWFRARQDASVNAMTPVVDGNQVLISSAYYRAGSVALQVRPDCAGYDERWSGLQLEMHWARPILVGRHLYGFSGRNEPDARFRCVNWDTGELKWDRAEGWPNAGHSKLAADEKPPDVFGRGSLILADGKLIALGEAGLLGIFRPDPVQPVETSRWQVPRMSYPCWAGPVLSEGRLYLRSEEWLVCYNLKRRD